MAINEVLRRDHEEDLIAEIVHDVDDKYQRGELSMQDRLYLLADIL